MGGIFVTDEGIVIPPLVAYRQTSEPTLDTDDKWCVWVDTDDSNRTRIIFRRGSGDQVVLGDSVTSACQFGTSYQIQSSVARVTTTGDTWLDKVTMTTAAFTGAGRVGLSCIVDAIDEEIGVRLYNNTDTTVLAEFNLKPKLGEILSPVTAFRNVTLTGSAKDIRLQYRSTVSGNTIAISDAHLEFWRVT